LDNVNKRHRNYIHANELPENPDFSGDLRHITLK
jgi:hypothetical protein